MGSALLVALLIVAGNAQPAGARGTHRTVPRSAARFRVGAAKRDITPHSLTGVYLGGYGVGPVHPAKAVLRHIFVRVLAVRDPKGNQVVIGSIDAQGYSVAYQNGPYGIADITADVHRELGIAPSDVILQSTHSHNGPDDMGVWGGVPNSYLAFVKAQTEAAIRQAVRRERRAVLRWATADMAGFSRTFGSDTDATRTGDTRDYPPDNQLRVLQAQTPRGHVIVTLVNY